MTKLEPSQDDTGSDLAVHIGVHLSSLSRTLSRCIDQATTVHGLSADHWYALDVIVRHDGIAMNDLAGILSVPAPTLTKFVDRLVAGALAFRLVDHADRRRVLVHASQRGGEVHRELSGQVTVIENDFLATFSLRDQQSLRRILDRLGS